jgi:hypothetical protein
MQSSYLYYHVVEWYFILCGETQQGCSTEKRGIGFKAAGTSQ